MATATSQAMDGRARDRALVGHEACLLRKRGSNDLMRAGRSMVPKLAALADANDAEFFDHLAPKDRAALLRTLREIVEKRGLKSLPVE
jgi:hypothetical protein